MKEFSLKRCLIEVLEQYKEDQGIEDEAAMRDLLTDARHICDSLGLDYGECYKNAYEVYIEELEQKQETQKEMQRIDEKHGLYADRTDIAN